MLFGYVLFVKRSTKKYVLVSNYLESKVCNAAVVGARCLVGPRSLL